MSVPILSRPPRPADSRLADSRLADPRAALLALALLAGPAAAQDYAHSPFREHPVALAQGAALERIAVAAQGLARLAAPLPAQEPDEDDAEGEEEEGLAAALPLFAASLSAAAPQVAAALPEAIGEMLEAAEDGESPAAPAAEVEALAAQARAALLPADLADTPAFQAALMAALLLDEGGVAESYEEASEGDPAAYAVGRAALQRVKAFWAVIRPAAAPDVAAEADAMLALLDGLFPGEAPPERLSPDPEEAEAPAHRLVGLLEAAADANLYPGRDLAGAVALVSGLADQGCAAIAAGQGPQGLETLAVAAAYHDQTLADTLGVIAPEAAEAIDAAFEPLEEGEAEEMAESCPALLAGLRSGGEALTQ